MCKTIIQDPSEQLLLLSNGHPVCRACPFTCCHCHRVLHNESFQKEDIHMYTNSEDSPFSDEETIVLLATKIARIYCQKCRSTDSTALPPELIYRCILWSLEEPTIKPFDKRNSALVDFCKVSRVWRSLAQPVLFSHVVLGWWGQEKRFLDVIEGRLELGEAVKSLRLGDVVGLKRVGAPSFRLGRLFELCSSLLKPHSDSS
ncbi:hypothetical protein T439DRAFT_215053 [Meredithblackwellia eburnea MCA 4105]